MVHEVVGSIPTLRFLVTYFFGGLAQLARAQHLQCWGHRFESDILHLLINEFQVGDL